MFAVSHTSVRSARMVNEARFQAASRDQNVSSLDPRCGGACALENQGGPTLEVLGVASVGRQRFTPQPRKNVRYQVLDTISYYTGPHQFKTGFDFNFIRQASRTSRCTSADGTSSVPFRRRRRLFSDFRPSMCRPSWPCSWAYPDGTFRDTATRPRRTTTRTFHCSPRMTGACLRGSQRNSACGTRCRRGTTSPTTSLATRRRTRSRATRTTSHRGWASCGTRSATGQRPCTAPTASTTTI